MRPISTGKHFEVSFCSFFFYLLFHVYFETRPETLHFNRVKLQSKPLIIDTEQFVKNTKIVGSFRLVYVDLVILRTGAVDRP